MPMGSSNPEAGEGKVGRRFTARRKTDNPVQTRTRPPPRPLTPPVIIAMSSFLPITIISTEELHKKKKVVVIWKYKKGRHGVKVWGRFHEPVAVGQQGNKGTQAGVGVGGQAGTWGPPGQWDSRGKGRSQ